MHTAKPVPPMRKRAHQGRQAGAELDREADPARADEEARRSVRDRRGVPRGGRERARDTPDGGVDRRRVRAARRDTGIAAAGRATTARSRRRATQDDRAARSRRRSASRRTPARRRRRCRAAEAARAAQQRADGTKLGVGARRRRRRRRRWWPRAIRAAGRRRWRRRHRAAVHRAGRRADLRADARAAARAGAKAARSAWPLVLSRSRRLASRRGIGDRDLRRGTPATSRQGLRSEHRPRVRRSEMLDRGDFEQARSRPRSKKDPSPTIADAQLVLGHAYAATNETPRGDRGVSAGARARRRTSRAIEMLRANLRTMAADEDPEIVAEARSTCGSARPRTSREAAAADEGGGRASARAAARGAAR